MSDNENQGTYTSPASIGKQPSDIVRRWLLELNIADKHQKNWVKTGEVIVDRYRGTKQKKNSFNILWANTETLSQAIYNTLPKPDVRRRYRDADPVGKIVSTVLERCADYAMDVYDFDQVLKLDLLDMLLPGRGISRVKYVPDFEDIDVENSQQTKEDDDDKENNGDKDDSEDTTDDVTDYSDEDSAQADNGDDEPLEKVSYERAMCEHVNWKDFRHGPGKTWDEVRWVAFRHKFSKTGGVDKFGDIFKQVTLDAVGDDDANKDERMGELFKTADVWEIWDKDNEEVLFISSGLKAEPLQKVDDPLALDGFFPCPRPLYAVSDSETLLPAPLFEKYRQQADELDDISSRINNLTRALKVRGVYNSVLGEIAKMQDLGDNQMIEAQNALALAESGGLEKNIWMMPIEQAANVIQILGTQREACKAVIYELTGIADIMRGATDSQETYGAQKIKATWGTQRLKKMQAEFQRYVRDIIRLKCQIIANKFQEETIVEMTGIQLLQSEQERMQLQQQDQMYQQYMQQQQQQAQQQPPGPPQGMPPQPMPPQGMMR